MANTKKGKKTTKGKTTTTKTPVKKVVEEVKEEKKEVKKDNAKRNMNILIFCVAALIIAICIILSSTSTKGTNNTTSSTGTEVTSGDAQSQSDDIQANHANELKEHTNISIDKYLELKEGSDYSIIYVARPTCGYCQYQDPILKYVAFKNNLTVNYLNTDDLDEDGFSKLVSSDEYFQGEWGTPITMVVKDDKIVDKCAGLTSLEELESFFKKYGLIK